MSNSELISNIINNITNYNVSPAMVQRDALNAIKKLLNNEHGIISAENPVALCLEMSAIQTAGHVNKNWVLNRRQYPVAANSHEDLYYHLSDLDWVGVFSLPATTKISMSFEYNEIMQILKPLPDGSGRLLRIPRGLHISVGGVDFLLDYPVNILQTKQGNFKITYDTSEKSPIQTLTTNIVKHNINSIYRETKRITIELEMIQVKEIAITDNITSNNNVTISSTFDDFYFYSRVFSGNDLDGYNELKTTHCPTVYNVTKPTAVLKLINNTVNNTLNITIPRIYNYDIRDERTLEITNTLGGRIKVLIYSTLGELSMNLGAYTIDQFSYDFFPRGKISKNYNELDEYSSALSNIRSVIVFSSDYINQGRDPLSFEELRDRVINNTTGPNTVPVSHASIRDKAIDKGFNIIKSVDYITNRIYWAIKPIPKLENSYINTRASSTIETLTTTITSLISNGNAIDNGKRVTIKPNSLFTIINGKLNILDKNEYDYINNLPLEDKVKELNNRELLYNPIHYVIDTNNDTVFVRPYYLDYPDIIAKYYNDSNIKVDISLSIHVPYIIIRTDNGYKIRIEMKSNDNYKSLPDNKLWSQLLVYPHNDNSYVYLNGVLTGRNDDNEPIFEYDLITNFDIDENNCLIFNNLTFDGSDTLDIPIDLENNFEFLFGIYGNIDGWEYTNLDQKLCLGLLDEDPRVILNESLHIRFGYYLKWLWSSSRIYADDIVYNTYSNDIPLLYEDDVYEKDPETGSIVNIEDDQVTYNLVHRKGDQVHYNGEPIFKHRKGDFILGSDGLPKVKEPRNTLIRLDLMTIDAMYVFASDENITDYRNELIATLVDWVVNDLEDLNKNTLEQTSIYYYPSSTMGNIKVMYDEGIVTNISAGRSLEIDFTVPRYIYSNRDAKISIQKTSIKIIEEEISKKTVSISSIISKLVNTLGDSIFGVSIRDLTTNDKIVSFTVLDDNKRATIRKKLTINSDGSIGLTEDIIFNFILHSV